MKIAYVTQPWDGIGMGSSIGIITCNLAAGLADKNQITIYTRDGKCNIIDSKNITYTYIKLKLDKYLIKFFRYLEKINFLGTSKKPLISSLVYYLIYALQIARDVKKNKTDIVHIHNYSQFVTVIRFFNPNVKIFLHMHCEWLTQFDKTLISKRLAKADVILGCSSYITSKVKSIFNSYSNKCFTLDNGVDIDIFKPEREDIPENNESEIHILFVGRVSPEKGVHILFEAFDRIYKKYKNVILDIVGPVKSVPQDLIIGLTDDIKIKELKKFYVGKKYREHLLETLSDGTSNKINFHQEIDSSKIVNFYNRANILVNPSFSESFGMSLIEAMASEVPVIASRVGGMIEIIEKSNAGLLFEAGNIEELYDCIEELINNTEKRKLLAKNGREFVVNNYTWKTLTEKLDTYYQNV
jgi:glycosyltransferase involved in cell wall biosynthesis